MTSSPDRVLQAAVREHLLDQVVQQQTTPASAPTASLGRFRSTRDRVRVTVAVLVAAATVAGSWYAIAAVQGQKSTDQPARPVAPASQHPTAGPTGAALSDPAVDPVQSHLSEVVGSGTFTGSVHGTFTITRNGTRILHLRGFQIGRFKARRILLAVDLASAECRGDRVGTFAGTITSARSQDVGLQDSSPQTVSDLSYMHAIALWPDDGCTDPSKVVAAAIHWHLPATIRDLARRDLGARTAAHGTVQLRKGRPIRYTVVSNDLITDVAARFGLTVNDLLYLNPLRRHGPDLTLYTGEQLNLDPLQRDYFST